MHWCFFLGQTTALLSSVFGERVRTLHKDMENNGKKRFRITDSLLKKQCFEVKSENLECNLADFRIKFW